MIPVLLADIVVFVALLATYLWLAERKHLPHAVAVAGATSWLIGGFLALALARVLGLEPDANFGLQLMGRIVPALGGLVFLWSRPDWLPQRTVNGTTASCVYREPAEVSAERVATFLQGKGLRATLEGYSVWVVEADVSRARELLPGFISWTLVHRGNSSTSARLLHDWLARNELTAQVRGEHKTGAIGGIPIPDSYPDLWVRGADRERAEQLINAFEDNLSRDAGTAGWSCLHCGEDNGPAFGSCWSCQFPRPAAPTA